MRVLAVHMILDNDHLNHIRLHWFAEAAEYEESALESGGYNIDLQSLSVFIRLHANVKRDPTFGLLDGQDANVLHVDGPSPCSYCQSGRRIRVVEREAEENGDFLEERIDTT